MAVRDRGRPARRAGRLPLQPTPDLSRAGVFFWN